MTDFLLGAITTAIAMAVGQGLMFVAQVIFYRYGSSAGSRAKDVVIAGQITPPPPIPVPPPVPVPVPPQPVPVSLPTAGVPTFMITGKMSTFGGPTDTGMQPDEDLALYDANNEAGIAGFLMSAAEASQKAGTEITGLGRRLDPSKFYLACRWDYTKTSKAFLRTVGVHATANGKTINCRPVDWGPNVKTGRIADLSPGAAAALGLQTDDVVTITVPLPASAPVTASEMTAPPASDEPRWLTLARAEIGFHETGDNMGIGKYVSQAGYGAEGEAWCSIFAGAMLKSAGVDTRGMNAMAQSVMSAPGFTKLDAPRLGAICVFWRGSRSSGEGHVGFLVVLPAADAIKISVLGGNENDQVEIESIPINGSTMGLLGYWWPVNATAEPKVT